MWFGIIVVFTVLTLLVTYLIPSGSPLVVLRYVFGFVFVAFLPGYCLVNVLFRGQSKNRVDFVEQLVLSVALTFGLDGLVGLFLGLSPIGIKFVPITVTLTGIVLVLAVVALVRMTRELPSLQVQPTQQVSA